MSQMLTQTRRPFNIDEVVSVGFSGTYGHHVTLVTGERIMIDVELYSAIIEFDNDGWFPIPANDVLEDQADYSLNEFFRG